MKYYKNAELVRRFGVSDKTVRNWIQAGFEGKLELKLYDERGRKYIADSVANNSLLEKLTEKGKKYRNNRSHLLITPSKKFYDLYKDHVFEIMNSVANHHVLPWSFTYHGDAATYWDQYLNQLYEVGTSNLMTNTIETLDLQSRYIDNILKKYDSVNVINICIGSSLTIKDAVSKINDSGKLKRFIALDISPDILAITKSKVKEWFPQIETETYLCDLRNEPFSSIICRDSFSHDASKTANLIFFVGGAIVNFSDPHRVLGTIRESIGLDDYLFITHKRDTQVTREFFDFNVKSDHSLIDSRSQETLRLLGINEDMYDFEQVTDIYKRVKYAQIRLKSSITLEFKTADYFRSVNIDKGESILIWQAKQYSEQDMVTLLNSEGFDLLQATQSLDNQLLLTISKLRSSLR